MSEMQRGHNDESNEFTAQEKHLHSESGRGELAGEELRGEEIELDEEDEAALDRAWARVAQEMGVVDDLPVPHAPEDGQPAGVEDAIILATQAHRGQVDRGGELYILHPLRLMMSLSTPTERIVALLHDTVKDTSLNFRYLETAGYTPEVIEAVECLTYREGEEYFANIERLRQNPVARRVKLAELRDNMNLERITHPTAQDHARMEKYQEALNILESK